MFNVSFVIVCFISMNLTIVIVSTVLSNNLQNFSMYIAAHHFRVVGFVCTTYILYNYNTCWDPEGTSFDGGCFFCKYS